MNPLYLIDFYKADHRRQYPPFTEYVYSNWTPRASRISGVNYAVFFGLQYFLQKYLMDDMKKFFFDRPKNEAIQEYRSILEASLGPSAANDIGTDHIAALHDLGYVPLCFKALPEGTVTPLRVPMFTIINTHKDFAWVTNYIETMLSASLWMACNSATLAYRLRKMLNERAMRSVGPTDFVQWQGHDFSFRGMASVEAANLSGMGHLLSFTGTDTLPAILTANQYYPGENGFIGGSVPATEHSCMSAGGKETEINTYSRILDLYPSGIVSVVSDTYDLWNVITHILPSLKSKIMSRNGKLVIRPDSGDPVKIICGDPEAEPSTPAYKGVVQLLWEQFGGVTNAKGYKELDAHIGCIYGDSITFDRADQITYLLMQKGFASTNCVFGVGSYTYQYNTRDTLGFAIKATWTHINGKAVNIFKDPKTDSGLKKSAKGLLNVVRDEHGSLTLVDEADNDNTSLLVPVWQDGQFIKRQSFADVRKVLNG